MGGWCRVSTNLWLFFFFFFVLWTERHHVPKPWLEFSQAPSLDAFVAAFAVGPETGVSRDRQVTRGRAGDSEDTGCWGPGAGLSNDPGGPCGFPLQLAGAGDGVCL